MEFKGIIQYLEKLERRIYVYREGKIINDAQLKEGSKNADNRYNTSKAKPLY